MKLAALRTVLMALFVAEQAVILVSASSSQSRSSSRAFLHSTLEVATWNRLQQSASVSSESRSGTLERNEDDDNNDQQVIPAFYRASSYNDVLSMHEVKYAYDRHRAKLQAPPQTELEFLENPSNRGR